VVDSDPAAEWQETLDKAGILTRLADQHGHSPAKM
jgi:anthranilate/para-aminobenzoate synthase component I